MGFRDASMKFDVEYEGDCFKGDILFISEYLSLETEAQFVLFCTSLVQTFVLLYEYIQRPYQCVFVYFMKFCRDVSKQYMLYGDFIDISTFLL